MVSKAQSKNKRSRGWIFVLNNPTQDEENEMKEALISTVVELSMVALEVGDSGTTHFQGMVELKNGKTMSAMKTWLGSTRYHLQPRKGSLRQAWAYSAKGTQSKEEWESSGEEGPNWGLGLHTIVAYGEEPPREVKKESSWESIKSMIEAGATYLEICDKFPKIGIQMGTAIQRYTIEWQNSKAGWRDVHTTFVTGKTGVGKTRSIMEVWDYKPYRITDYKHPWDAYNGESVIILEEFRNSLKIEQMLNILDGYPVRLPCRYADRMAQFTRVFIVTNWEFGELYEGIQERHPETWNAFVRRIGLPWDQSIPDVVKLNDKHEAHLFRQRLELEKTITELSQEEE